MDHQPTGDEVLYGLAGGALVFIPRAVAERLITLRGGLYSAATWGQLREELGADLFDEVLEQCRDYLDEEAPSDDDPFERDGVPGYADGDWPDWPKQMMLDWMPRHLQKAFGKVVASTLNGDFLSLDPEKVDDLVVALEAEGFSCRRNDEAVARASGF